MGKIVSIKGRYRYKYATTRFSPQGQWTGVDQNAHISWDSTLQIQLPTSLHPNDFAYPTNALLSYHYYKIIVQISDTPRRKERKHRH